MKKFLLFLIVNTIIFLSNNIFAAETADILNDDILNYSKITDSDLIPGQGAVIWIQDLHKDPEVQKNIYNIINSLSKNKNLGSIYTEGINKDCFLDVSFLKNIPGPLLKEKTIQNLLENGTLSGSEYFAAVNDKIKIFGIEDRNIYDENSERLNIINKEREFNTYITDKIKAFCDTVRNSYIPYGTTAEQNKNICEIYISDNYPNLKKQQNILNSIKKINKKDFTERTVAFISEISKELNTEKASELKKYTESKTPYGYKKAYDIICTAKNNYPEKYTDIILFFRLYSELYEINPIQLAEESEQIKRQNVSSMSFSEAEFADLEYFAGLLKKFVNTDITPAQYGELTNNSLYVSYLFGKYLPSDLKSFALLYLNSKNINTFHENNILRNDVFIKNFLDTADRTKINLIIAGGFHSGITEKLKELNISYIVLTPNVALSSAFNQLFSSRLTNGTETDKANAVMSIIKEWGVFFSDPKTFGKQVNSWLKNNPTLKGLSADISTEKGVFKAVINFTNGFTTSSLLPYSEEYLRSGESKTFKSDIMSSSYLTSYTLKKFEEFASQPSYFGKDIQIELNNDDSLFEKSAILPITVRNTDTGRVISVNSKFLNALSVEEDKVTETVVKLLFICFSPSTSDEKFNSFFETNKDELKRIYSINSNLARKATLTGKIKNFFAKINIAVRTTPISTANVKNIERALKNENDRRMLEAVRQAELARQTRSRHLAIIQPPVGAYITDENGITGRNFNRTDSVLHAETLTIIDYLRNYIFANGIMPDGTLSAKGNVLNTLLDMITENGSQVKNKLFFKNKALLESMGIKIEYDKNGHITKCKKLDELDIQIKNESERTNDDVFNETNLVLSLINSQLGNPLNNCELYCTLAPCNKCVSTMAALKIKSLYYASQSKNSYHTSQKKLEKHNVSVSGEILMKETDKYIRGYTYINKSKIKTRIASALQNIRKIIRAVVYTTSKDRQESLYTKLSGLISGRTAETRDLILKLQKETDWNNITDQTDLTKLENFLQDVNAWNDPVKRAGIIYILSHPEITPFTENNELHFSLDGQTLPGIYINQANEIAVSDSYRHKMEQLAAVRNVADMDDNLAARDTPFSNEMKKVLNNLILYGIASPIIVTGNTLEQTRDKRFASLGWTTPKLIQMFFTEHGALEYTNDGTPETPLTESFKMKEDYAEHYSHALIDRDTIKELDQIFRPYINTWSELLTDYLKIMHRISLKNKSMFTYDDVIKAFDEREDFKHFLLPVLSSMGYKIKTVQELSDKWQKFSRAEAKTFLEDIYSRIIRQKKERPENFIQIMRLLSIFEMNRVYFSQANEDEAENISLKKAVKKYLDEKILPKTYTLDDMDVPTRFVISPMRPTLVREIFADYFRKRVTDKKFKDLELTSSGQTTININKKGISKVIPLKLIATQAGTEDTIIYTGDDFGTAGVDYPVYEMAQKSGQMLVINTDKTAHPGDFISLVELNGFSNEDSITANTERSFELQKRILKIVEENIRNILTDYSNTFVPQNIAKRLRYEIINPDVQVIDIQETKIEDTAAMLRAG